MSSCCCVPSTCPEIRSRISLGAETDRDVSRLVPEIRSRISLGAETDRDASRLVPEEDHRQEVQNRTNMDISLLRAQYEQIREQQKRQTRVQLLRRVSEDLSEAVRVVPVTQGLLSPWEPKSISPTANFDPTLATSDPWHTHLGLHRRACLRPPPPAVTGLNSSSMSSCSRSSSLSESGGSLTEFRDVEPSVDSTTSSLNTSREVSPSSSLNSSQGDGFSGSFTSTKVDPGIACHHGSLDGSKQRSSDSSKEHDTGGSAGGSAYGSFISSKEDSIAGSLASFEEGSTPVGSVVCSANGSTADLDGETEENKPVNGEPPGRCEDSSSAARGSGRSTAPRLARQHSLGGPPGPHHHYPFPRRKSLTKSEAARRLGMYSSF
ncbi:uncharacterized protein ACJ7VT_016361 [Polymixia lowei]